MSVLPFICYHLGVERIQLLQRLTILPQFPVSICANDVCTKTNRRHDKAPTCLGYPMDLRFKGWAPNLGPYLCLASLGGVHSTGPCSEMVCSGYILRLSDQGPEGPPGLEGPWTRLSSSRKPSPAALRACLQLLSSTSLAIPMQQTPLYTHRMYLAT